MASDSHPTGNGLDALLGELPEGFVLRDMAGAWFVAGPTGVYVVAATDPPDLAHLARGVRDALADHLTLVPFVHPLLVSDRPAPTSSGRATVVPPDLLHQVLVGGRPVLDEPTLARIAAVASSGGLDPGRSRRRPPMRGWLGAAPVY